MRRSHKRYADWDSNKLNLAFIAFRKAGLIARQTFTCCGSCAGYELASGLGDKVKKVWDTKGPVRAKMEFVKLQRKIKGVVFYHRQDREGLEESGEVYLAFGDVEAHCVGTFGLPTVEVGKLITGICTELGIKWEWDGSEHSRILLDLRSDYQRKKDEEKAAKEAAYRARWEREDFERETGIAMVPMFPPSTPTA